MKKYSAVFQIGWMKITAEGNTVKDLVSAIEKEQDLRCLLRMGSSMEPEEGRSELAKLEDFMEKYYSGKLTFQELKELEINLSVGTIKCLEFYEQNENV